MTNETMKRMLSLAMLMAAPYVAAHADDQFFKPYAQTDLRLPAVPLVLVDPNTSVWSPADELTAHTTVHWTGTEHPLDGFVRIDGTPYRFMGATRDFIAGEPLMKMANQEAWTARVSYDVQSGTGWAAEGFDDSAWDTAQGAFGEGGEYPNVRTRWVGADIDIYVRRHLTLTAEDLQRELWVIFSHDDVFELFVNGQRVVQTGLTWKQGEMHKLTASEMAYLHEGDNIIAAHCHNTSGGAYVDFGVYPNALYGTAQPSNMPQTDVNVLATSTYYTFEQAGVQLDVVFTAPMLLDDLYRMATPANYISFRVTPTDGHEHDVQLYLGASPELAVYQKAQPVQWQLGRSGVDYARVGANPNNPLSRSGDGVILNWGYLYLMGYNGSVNVGDPLSVQAKFFETGELDPLTSRLKTGNAAGFSEYPTLAYVHDFGTVSSPAASHTIIGYDDTYAMKYLDRNYPGYWTLKYRSLQTAMNDLDANYDEIMTRCRQQDSTIYTDAFAVGGKEYAELLSGSFRQVIAAHKMFQDEHGHLMFFSKENFSGGMVNTLDVTYPSEPLFLLYNVELAKAMLTSMMEYAESDRWGFDFAPHDLGAYPIANGQVYSITRPNSTGGYDNNMPIEESGNMLCLMSTIAMIEGNADYPGQYWETLKTWADYLSANGQDPENQLCTDDFAGHLAHNANLALKAIFGVAGFAEMARLKGDAETANTYLERAREMAAKWAVDDLDRTRNHYKLTLDRNGTWSQKYNAVWDALWRLNLLPEEVMTREIAYYLTRQQPYGLPLDSRDLTTKSDWVMWTASMAADADEFRSFMLPIYKYVNETPDRVPIVDRHHADTGRMVGMQARSVIGGYWMRLLMERFDPSTPGSVGHYTTEPNEPDAIREVRNENLGKKRQNDERAYYNLSGQRLTSPQAGLNIVLHTDGQVEKVMMK